MRITRYSLVVLALCVSGCAYTAASTASRVTAYDELRSLVGQTVEVRGDFSLWGKFGPFVLVDRKPVYLIPSGSFTWGQSWADLEGNYVAVKGTLRYYQSPPAVDHVDNTSSRPPDHFYFKAESASVELVGE